MEISSYNILEHLRQNVGLRGYAQAKIPWKNLEERPLNLFEGLC